MQDQSSSGKVMGRDCGAETSRDLHATPDTAGMCGLKCALVKAGTLVMQVEIPVWGRGHHSAGPEARGAPGSRWGQVVPVGPCLSPAFAQRWPWQSPWGGRSCSAEKKGSKCFPRWSTSWHLSSLTSAPLALTGPSWLLAASLQLPAPGAPLAGTASPAREQGAEGWAAERTSSLGPLIQPQQSSGLLPGSPCQARV